MTVRLPANVRTASGVRCRWYLADDVRSEPGGKWTILGLYADDIVVIQMPPDVPDPSVESPVAIEGLTVLCILRGLKGREEFHLSLNGSAPAHGLGHTLMVESNSPDASISIVSRFRPIFIESFGKKVFSIECERLGFQEDFVFHVNRRDLSEPGHVVSVSVLQGSTSMAEKGPKAPPKSLKGKMKPSKSGA